MRSKFNVGDEIFFMNGSEATKGEIVGISFIVGEFKTVYFDRKGSIDKPSISYSLGSYSDVPEEKAFSTKEELIQSVFSKI